MDSIVSGYKEESVIIKDELKKMKIAFTYDCKKKGKGERTQGLFTGFKEIKYENDLVDDETDQETTEL